MVRRIVIVLTRQARRALQRKARKTKDAELRTRILIVLLYNQGLGARRIANTLNTVPMTAQRVAHRYLENGYEGLLDGRRGNGSPKVDDDLLQALAELLKGFAEDHGWKRPTWTREALAKSLEEMTGIAISVTTVSRMLKRLGARYGSARPTVLCPWPKAKKRRHLAKLRKLIKHLPRDEVVFYEDEVDIHLNPRIGRDWTLPRKQRVIVTPGRNEKRYVAGALAADGSALVFVASDRKNTDLFLALLEKLHHLNPKARRIHLILDNYVIHSSKRAQRFLAAHGELFVLHFLPPYSPEHNRIERLWRELHANVTRNHRCSSMRQLMRNVACWLRAEHRRRRREHAASRCPRTRRAA